MLFEITPLGRYRVGARHVAGLWDIGVDQLEYYPPPSTALGALATALGIHVGDNAAEALGCSEVWGPLFKVGDDLYFITDNMLISVKKLGDYVEAARGGRENLDLDHVYKFKVVKKPSVSLTDEKTARAYFSPSYVWLVEETQSGESKPVDKFSILYYINCDKAKAMRGVARVGGEGRLALISVSEVGYKPKPCKTGVLLSPLLFHSEGPWAEVEKTYGLQNVVAIYGRLEGRKRIKFRTRSVYTGLGFSIARGERRAIYQSIPPGTVVELKDVATHAGLFTTWGYGSLLCHSH
ncbi:MAG: CRISPR-associated protein Cas5 [Pyrobaculum sp.]